MNRSFKYVLFFLLVWVQPVAATDLVRFSGKVIAVADGDTITVLHDNHPVKIRLAGIDCPELHQAFGDRAKRATSDLVFGKVVTVTPTHFDRYRRLIASVRLADGRVLEHELLRVGMGWWYFHYAPYDGTLRDLEERAHKLKVGLWADKDPVPPWEFRKNH